MPIIAEDGTGSNPQANSYADEDFIRQYAKNRGYELPEQSGELSQLSFQVMDVLEAERDNFLGSRTLDTQPLQFPRKDLRIDNVLRLQTEVPVEAKNAQAEMIALAHSGVPLRPTSEGPAIRRTKTDVLETEFAIRDGDNQDTVINMPSVDRWLDPLRGRSSGFGLTVRRG